MRARTGIGRLVTIAAVAVALNCIAVMQIGSPSRLEHGTLIYRNSEEIRYQWISNHDLLIIPPPARRGVRGNFGWQAVRFDVNSCQSIPMPRLSALFRNDWEAPQTAQASPDGSRLLWRSRAKIWVTDLNGAALHSWPDPGFALGLTARTLGWSGDSRHFVELERAEPEADAAACTAWTAVTRSVDRPAETSEVRLPFNPPLDYSRAGYFSEPSVTVGGSILTHAPIAEWAANKTIVTVPIREAATRSTRTVAAPAGASFVGQEICHCQDMVISPSGDRIIWLGISVPRDSPFRRWLASFVPGLNHEARRYSLYISDSRGGRMRELTCTEAMVYPDSASWQGATDVRWLPGGKRVSYVYRHNLYTLPVD